MNSSKKSAVIKGGRFSLLDVLIILFVIAAVFGAAWFLGFFATEGDVVEITYTVELRGMKDFFYDVPAVGDDIHESIKDEYLGKVSGVSFKPTVQYTWSHESLETTEQVVPNEKDMYITIAVDGYESDSTIMTKDDSVELKVGKGIYIKGKGYAASGYITDLKTISKKGD